MFMKKRLLKVMSLVLVSTMILTGCQSKNKEDSNSNSDTTVTPVQQNGETQPDSNTDEQVTITFWDENAGDARTEYYMELISRFEKENPNIKIEYLGLASSDALSKYQLAVSTGETPDVGSVNQSWASTIINMGHCVALDDMFNAWDESSKINDSYIQLCRESAKDGKLYMMPTTSNFICLWTNTAMFKEANLEVPKTWDEFFDCAEKLTDLSKGQYGYTIRGGAASPAILIDFIYSYMGIPDVFDENGNCTINSDKAVEFCERYFGLYNRCTPESDITAGYKEISANFDSGICAMFTHNLGSYQNHVKAFNGLDGFECNPLPVSDNGTYINNGSMAGGPVMFDTCKNKEAAFKWICYLCSKEGNSFWNQSIGQMPTNTDVFEEGWVSESKSIQCAVNTFKEYNVVNYAQPSYLPENGTINSTYIEPAIQSVMSGDMSVKEMLDLWASHLTEAYKEYNK